MFFFYNVTQCNLLIHVLYSQSSYSGTWGNLPVSLSFFLLKSPIHAMFLAKEQTCILALSIWRDWNACQIL